MKKIFFVVLGVILITGAGCSNYVAKKTLEKTSGGKVNIDNKDGSIKVSTDDSALQRGGANKLPEDWPKDAPTYFGANILFSGSVPGSGGVGISVILQTNDSIKDVFDFYNKELADKKWKIIGSYQGGDMATLNVEKDTRFFTVSIVASGGLTSITATVGNK